MTAMWRCAASISWKRSVAEAPAALHGWIIIDKPLGMGSTNVVSWVKRALREGGYAKVKTGHGGTLDPLATGILPVALGEATKLAGRMLDASKVYDFTITFGTQTDSLDLEGTVIAQSDVRPTLAAVEAVLPQFTGPITQVPPAFSALKVDGKRAYDLARAGEDVVLAGRDVIIHSLTISSAPSQVDGENVLAEVTLTAHVSKGTYIRSLARDIALALGTVGHVTMLRRVRAGPFGLEQAISLDILDQSAKARTLGDLVLPLRTALVDIPALALDAGQALALRQGRVLSGVAVPDGFHLATLAEVPVALVSVDAGAVTVERGFNL
jgi:tRNA pseudouridine55 synthase